MENQKKKAGIAINISEKCAILTQDYSGKKWNSLEWEKDICGVKGGRDQNNS